jgi:3-hydroxybutyryl-CoA dehydrogenase
MLVILASGGLKEELLMQGVKDDVEINWISDPAEFANYNDAEGFIDLGFDYSAKRVDLLRQLPARPVMISAIAGTLSGLPSHFIRVNAWPTFLKRTVLEAACASEEWRKKAESIITVFGKTVTWTPDVPGFISARVVAMIINEAYFSLREGVSSREEMDTAMKLGTNYPYGPFEWSSLIGTGNVAGLLQVLAKEEPRYQPSVLLQNEAIA